MNFQNQLAKGMKFFDQGGNLIEFREWLATYEPYYFLDRPKDYVRNKTSHFVENRVCSLLERSEALSRGDLILAMAWKVGAINHFESELRQEIVYVPPDWSKVPIEPRYKRYDYTSSISKLAERMAEISGNVNQGRPKYLWDMRHELPGFGPVYVLTILFFVSHGRFPIYDKFADIAIKAIHEDLRPGTKVQYKGIEEWQEYCSFMRKLEGISTHSPADHRMFIPRDLDRALWVYGHFFTEENPSRACV